MGKMMNILRRYKEEIGLFVVITVYLFLAEGFGCKIFTKFDFDSQAFLFWNYAAIEKYIPYKDIFYPYGLLFYFKDANLFFQLLFYTIPAILCTVLYFLLKKTYPSRFNAAILIVVFVIFIQRFIGMETMGRYGVAVIYALLFGLLFSKQIIPRLWIVAIGISIGLVFSLLNDQGIYASALFLFFLLMNPILHREHKDFKRTVFKIILSIVIFISSFLIGLLPLTVYLISQNSVSSFVSTFLQNSDIALFAKTPFPPFAASPENIFTFLILFVTMGILLAKRWIYREKYELLDFLQLSVVLLVIILEQKSIIRSIDSQITFLALILYFFLFAYLIKFFQKEKISLFYPFGLFVLMISYIFLGGSLRVFQKNYIVAGTFDKNYCLTANKWHLVQKYPEYQKVVTYIHSNSPKNTRIFSYPGDPLFYILFHQDTPYYPSSYEVSPLHAQKKQIEFIESKEIMYVIYNTDIFSIQDGVPDFIRTPELTGYIFTHFYPIKKIGKFLIFKRGDNHDMFTDKGILPSKFAQFLLNVNLASIPKSEAIYKSKSILSSEIVAKKRGINSKNLFLFIQSHSKNDVTVRIFTDTMLKTTVTMSDCMKGCIVDVSKLPLFYNPRTIKKIDVSSDAQTSLVFFRTSNPVFW